jgi:4-hydroxy-3-polyprenylbenzoate decarboxylase
VDAFTKNKHWGCKGPLILDATIKKHHAPPVLKDAEIEKRVDAILAHYGY